MSVLNPLLMHQSLRGIVEKLDAFGAVEAIVLDVLHLSGHGPLCRADELYATLQIMAVVGIHDGDSLIAQLGIRQGPVTRHPCLWLGDVFAPIDVDMNSIRLSVGRYPKLFAVIVALAN